jgi:hypothetical protein
MDAAGEHAGNIWKQTGWSRSPVDGMWRWEVPDIGSKLKVDPGQHWTSMFTDDGKAYTPGPQTTRIRKLSDVFDHPDAYNAYPNLKDIEVKLDPTLPDRVRGQVQQGKMIALNPVNVDNTAGAIRSTLLHEMQHVVQNTEGFARGGDVGVKDWLQGVSEQRLSDVRKQLGQGSPEYVSALADHDAILKSDEFELYKRLAGEVEARNVQARADMTPQRLREQYPHGTPTGVYRGTMDRPAHQQLPFWPGSIVQPKYAAEYFQRPRVQADQWGGPIGRVLDFDPVEHDPFQSSLEPVEHDPFQGEK